MKIRKIETIDIDLCRIRKWVINTDFTPDEKKRLLKLYDLFEQGKFIQCVVFTSDWGRTKDGYDEKEYIDGDVWKVLHAIAWNAPNVKFERE